MVVQPATSSPGETDAAMPSHSLPHSGHIDAARPRPNRAQQLLALLHLWHQRSRAPGRAEQALLALNQGMLLVTACGLG